jgi:hypothetical protein
VANAEEAAFTTVFALFPELIPSPNERVTGFLAAEEAEAEEEEPMMSLLLLPVVLAAPAAGSPSASVGSGG